uniref:CAAX prenyl protease 2/Lysostaphin resistance protein A-like domain-containing protein n=1 Tax=Thermogemmatispora argillosa TaxID=2045280 RepID=A0A455SYM9_9CHLR|nr:hypothetical protein KTA_04600 [Thermogemmatispora argillosa]
MLLQYGLCRRLLMAAARRLAEQLPLSLHYPTRDLALTLAVAGAGLTALGIAWAVSWANGQNLPGLFTEHLLLLQLPIGVLLGLGEASVSMLLSSLALALFRLWRQRQIGPGIVNELRAIGRAGWVRAYRQTLQIWPAPVGWAIITLALLGEELLFRGLAARLLAPEGFPLALVTSTLLFVAVQEQGMPSWFSALPAMCGALVIGPINAWLLMTVPNILPLVLAHLTFFTVMIL